MSVVIPVYNARSFLADALSSARNQSYRQIEIIVIDDGSDDGSVELAQEHAQEDKRVRVLRQPRRGPSAARNAGIAQARGALIAPLDADDLWRPTKIERQVAAMRQGGDRVGLVYTWFALIDEDGRVRSTGHRPTSAGEVLRDCCRRNLVGNGSGALMRRSAILECGGYDESLHGSEDLKLYTAIAERYQYAVVTEHLTGYRQTNRNLTSDVDMIRRSTELVLAQLARRHPELELEIRGHKRDLYHWLLRRGLAARRWKATLVVTRSLWDLDWLFALRSLAGLPKDLTAGWRISNTGGPAGQPYFLAGICTHADVGQSVHKKNKRTE